ncbi:MAG: YidC/Oxa1 family membrane protein insertase [Treponema sp.]|nr:YidC/Oxa1 family membrane protein insertase [Treponema sp.]
MLEALYNMIIYPITFIIDFVCTFSMKIFKEPGISIMAISFFVSLLCLPLYTAAEKIQHGQREIEKKLKAKTGRIKAVFSGDEQYMMLAAYYRQNHYHPIYAVRSSLGLLIQIPFFIAAYHYISGLELIKGAPFLFIADLGRPDNLLGGLNVLPLAMTLINCSAAYVYTRNSFLKEKLQLMSMALLFLALLYNAPSGLVLYWTLNNVFSLIKNIYFASTWRRRRFFLLGLVSLASILLVCFIQYNNIANERLRLLLSVFFTGIALFPWLAMPLKKTAAFLFSQKISEKQSGMIFILSAGALFLLAGALIPSALIGSSPEEFSYIDRYTSPFPFLFTALFQAFGLLALWPAFFYFASSITAKKMFAVAFLFIVLISLLDFFMFSGNYGFISVNLIFDNEVSDASGTRLKNCLAIFIVLLLLAAALVLKKISIVIPPLLLTVVSLVGLSAYNCYAIQTGYKKLDGIDKAKITRADIVTGDLTEKEWS